MCVHTHTRTHTHTHTHTQAHTHTHTNMHTYTHMHTHTHTRTHIHKHNQSTIITTQNENHQTNSRTSMQARSQVIKEQYIFQCHNVHYRDWAELYHIMLSSVFSTPVHHHLSCLPRPLAAGRWAQAGSWEWDSKNVTKSLRWKIVTQSGNPQRQIVPIFLGLKTNKHRVSHRKS